MTGRSVEAVRALSTAEQPVFWHRRRISRYRGSAEELKRLLPRFKRELSGGTYHIRRADAHGPAAVVGHVSCSYVLVQHHDLLDALPEILGEVGIDWSGLTGELAVTPHGERMELVLDLPMPHVIPRDGFPLVCRLRCVNSVDRSSALEAELQWYRLVCSNGMFGWTGERVRRQHRFEGAVDWVQRHLRRRFGQVPIDLERFDSLHQTPVSTGSISDWTDVFVARSWGRTAAAAVYNVCTRGVSGRVLEEDDLPPHALEIESAFDVPGACAPATNLYHVGQALSWVAGQSETLHARFSRTSQVPSLLQLLG
jgi:hypothetical protein